jgi:ribosomal protein S18 acetylase RimI-like enzyme
MPTPPGPESPSPSRAEAANGRPSAAAGADTPFVLAEGDLRLPAVARLVGGPGTGGAAHARRFIEYAARQKIDIRRLWTELDEAGRPVRSALVVPNPGRTAVVFAGPTGGTTGAGRLGALIDHASRHEDPARTHLVQALVEPEDAGLIAALAAARFVRLADLGYLERSTPSRPLPEDPWPADARVVPWDETRREDVLGILLASYEDTLDCPGLRGLRDAEDILEGHRRAGVFEPGLWRILEIDGRPAGVAMLNPSPGSASIELVYLGLAVRARGRGLGRNLLVAALNGVVGRPEHTISLAVDLRNEPALALYRGLGFHHRMRRIAFIRSLRELPDDTSTVEATPAIAPGD